MNNVISCRVCQVSFEAQDEGVIAKILVPGGGGEIKVRESEKNDWWHLFGLFVMFLLYSIICNLIKVGQPILVIVEEESQVAAFANYTPEPTVAAAAAAPASPKPAAAAPSPPPPPPAPPAPAAPAASSAPPAPGGRVFASPLAKTLAAQLGYSLGSIPGTGPNGRIVAADVREFVPPVQAAGTVAATAPSAAVPAAGAAAAPRVTPAPAPIPGAGYTDYPLSESSKEIAARLTVAKQTVPHYYLTVDLLLGKLLEVREKLNKELKDDQDKLSVNDFFLKAAALASKKVPEANASWHGDFVRQYHSVDINVMVGVGDGLLAPVVRQVDTKGLKAISSEVKALVQGSEDGSLSSEALQTGTFTLVNVGMYGVKSVAPIVSLPQACVLGVGGIENRVVPSSKPPKDGEEGEVYEVVPGVTVTLSCDHRVIDGAVGAQWLSAFKSLVEDPVTLLL